MRNDVEYIREKHTGDLHIFVFLTRLLLTAATTLDNIYRIKSYTYDIHCYKKEAIQGGFEEREDRA